MKKLIASIAALVVALGSAFAQDLAAVTEIYNAGAAAVSTDKESALKSFEQALQLATALGEEGQEVVANCKNIIPNLKLSIAKLAEALEVGEKYEALDVVSDAKELIPQVKMSKAGNLLNAKDYDGAIAAYKEIVDADATNGAAALRLGVAYNAAGKLDEAKAAFEQAAANGQEATAKKQIGNIYLKEAAASLKEKKYADAVAAAAKVNEYTENAQARHIAGQASQLAGTNSDAIKYRSEGQQRRCDRLHRRRSLPAGQEQRQGPRVLHQGLHGRPLRRRGQEDA